MEMIYISMVSKNKLHIITPFSRPENFCNLFKNFKGFDSWTLIFSEDQYNSFIRDDIRNELSDKEIFPMIAKNLGKVDGAYPYRKINRMIESFDGNDGGINDEDYYIILCDDDGIPEGLIDEIKNHNEDVLVVSLKRGDSIPKDAICKHGISTLLACPENMVVGKCGCMQAIVKGKVLRKIRFNENVSHADGLMMEWLAKNYKVTYLPELFINFNYFQPGRWKNGRKE